MPFYFYKRFSPNRMDHAFLGLDLLFWIIEIIILWILTLPMFINLNSRIARKGSYRFLSFFLLPLVAMIGATIYDMTSDSPTSINIFQSLKSQSPVIVPFFSSLIVGYIWFVIFLKRNLTDQLKHTE